MGLAVHGRERGDVAKSADRPAHDLGTVGLTGIFKNPDAAGVRLGNDLVDFGRLAGGMYDADRRYAGPETLDHLLNADIELSGLLSHKRGLSPLRMIALNDPGSVMGEIRTSLPLGRSSAASATKSEAVPVATASA